MIQCTLTQFPGFWFLLNQTCYFNIKYICIFGQLIYFILAARKGIYRHLGLIGERTRSVIIQVGQWTTLSSASHIGKCHWSRHIYFSVEESRKLRTRVWDPAIVSGLRKSPKQRSEMLSSRKRMPGIHKTSHKLKVLQTMGFPAQEHINLERTLRGPLAHEALIGEDTPTATVHHK